MRPSDQDRTVTAADVRHIGSLPLPYLQLRAFGAMSALIAAVALVVTWIPGWDGALRDTFAFRMKPSAAEVSQAVALVVANAKPTALLLAGSLTARVVHARPLVDATLAALLLSNCALIGLALGAYGTELLPWLVHLPLELAALAVPAGLYLRARRWPVSPEALLTAAVLGGALLVAAAATEIYLTPHR